MSERNDHAAPKNAVAQAHDAVRDPAARQAEQIDHRGVQTVDRATLRSGKAKSSFGNRRGHEQNEQRAHSVITEALPHLCEEEGREPARMAEERAIPLCVAGWRGVACRNGVRHFAYSRSPTRYSGRV